MAKRFITTELFEDAWFMDLPSKFKLFWIYLLTKCDASGIWQVNWKIAQFYIGDNLEPAEVQRIFASRIVPIEKGKYWFIPKFVEFQYGTSLSRSNKATLNVIKSLEKYGLFDYLSKTQVIEGASKELPSSLNGAQDKDKDKDEEKEEDKAKQLWISTIGKNPNHIQLTDTIELIHKHDLKILKLSFCDWARRDKMQWNTFLINLDDAGRLKSWEEKQQSDKSLIKCKYVGEDEDKPY